MLDIIVVAIIVVFSVLVTPRVVQFKKPWHRVLTSAIVAVILVAVWDFIKPT